MAVFSDNSIFYIHANMVVIIRNIDQFSNALKSILATDTVLTIGIIMWGYNSMCLCSAIFPTLDT